MRNLIVPDEVNILLCHGAALSISISGGKDGQAMAYAVKAEYDRRPEWTGSIFLLHADLGRVEWHTTHDEIWGLAAELGLPLHIVSADGDLLDAIIKRKATIEKAVADGTGENKPFWPSSAARYCTARMKREPINKFFRRLTTVNTQPLGDCSDLIVSCEGVRAEESAARAKKPVWEERKTICTKQRYVLDWRPIHDWTLDDVWEALGTNRADVEFRRKLWAFGDKIGQDGPKAKALCGWKASPVYIYGNERKSCKLCVLASDNDIRNGAKHDPEHAREYLRLEAESGWAFKHNKPLSVTLAGVI